MLKQFIQLARQLLEDGKGAETMGDMSKEAREARRAYMKEYRKKNKKSNKEYLKKWRQANPEKVKEYNRRYWERKAAEQQEQKEA